ncbi:MAG: hypothetical protein EOP52_06745 [Sphingobacteriales bacterium]|nr:MAG: hypothetical protein EOP52_06745 [Sphingobacteriales bacterium]
MDSNNKQQHTDLNQHAANKIPHNAQENKIPADPFRNEDQEDASADGRQPGTTASTQHGQGTNPDKGV